MMQFFSWVCSSAIRDAMEALDFEQIAREMLTALRGTRSQVAWSRRLGYRSNVAYAWESGRRWPTAAETFRAVAQAGIDLQEALETFYVRAPKWLEQHDPASPEGVAAFLDDLRGNLPIFDLADGSTMSRYSISRWLSGQTQPRLPDFLRYVEFASMRAIDLVAALVQPAQMPTVYPIWKQLENRRQGADRLPWTQAILRGLELTDYLQLPRHRRGWLASRLGIDEAEEARCIAFLLENNQITWDGERYRLQQLAVDTGRSAQINRRLKAHWTRVGAARIERGAFGQFSYNVFNISHADFERIREAHLNYFRTLRAIVDQSSPEEVVAVANVQLFTLEDRDAAALVSEE